MAEEQNSHPSIMSRFLSNWDLDSVQTEDKAMLYDDESELSDNMSLTYSMDADMNPFELDPTALVGKPYPKIGSYSVQFLLPLEVRCQVASLTGPY
jgi:hypothetical protein